MKLSKLSVALIAASTTYPPFALAADLEPVIVSANHTQMSATSVTANSYVISAIDLADNHYTTVTDALKKVPGLIISRNGGLGGVTSIKMRGQTNKDVLVLINGIEMNNPMGTGGPIYSNLLLSDVERIEILKGAQSGIWGANASAGVINIITKKAQLGTQTKVNVEAGSNNSKKLAASISSATEEGDFSFNFANTTTDGFSAVKGYKKDAKDYEKDGFTQTDFSLNIGVNIDSKNRVELLVKNAQSTSDYDFSTNPNADAVNNFASVDYTNQIMALQHKYQANNFNSTVYLSQNEISQYSDAVINSLGIKGGYTYAQDQSLAFNLVKNQYQNLGNHNSYYNTGLGLTNTNHFNNKKLIITQSLRSDKYSDFDDKTTGKLGVKNYFNDDVYLSANYGTAYNAPTLFQSTYGVTSNINPEESKSFDINLGAYGLLVSYYKTETKNLINYGGAWPNDYYENIAGTSKFEGLELSYQRFIDAIDTQVGLNYSKGTAKDANNEWLARRAEQTLGLNLNYQGFDDLTLIADTRYIGKMYDKANQGGANIGEYFVTDLALNYEVNSQLTVYAKVLNAFNEDYTDAVAAYETDGTTPKFVYSNGGRQFFIGLQADL